MAHYLHDVVHFAAGFIFGVLVSGTLGIKIVWWHRANERIGKVRL